MTRIGFARASHRPSIALASLAAVLALGCSATTDSLGSNQAPTVADDVSPSPFGELLGKSQTEVDEKLANAFEQLFHGDPATEAIYVETDDDQAYIYNIAEAQIRTDGLGYGLMITVELDRPDEFASLWEYATTHLRYDSGPAEGYLFWDCPEAELGCPDPNGMQYAALALSFAARRWDEPAYADAADELLEVMLHREELNGGVVSGVRNVFDQDANVARTQPVLDVDVDMTTSSFALPAFTELFAATGADAERWTAITAAERELLRSILSTATGLPVEYSDFAGTPLVNTTFGPEAQRVGFNLALDHVWHGTDWAPEVDTMLEFFLAQPQPYAAEYDAESGNALDGGDPNALWATNGAAAVAASIPERVDFVEAVWDMPIPTGTRRYYPGVLYLMSLLVLSGEFQIL